MSGGSLEIEIFGWGESLAVKTETVHAVVGHVLSQLHITNAHLAISIISSAEIAALNARYRGKETPTDVLAFPIDEDADISGPRELGDVVICPQHTDNLLEVVVHGVLHLCGYDHERDQGQMLALQAELIASFCGAKPL